LLPVKIWAYFDLSDWVLGSNPLDIFLDWICIDNKYNKIFEIQNNNVQWKHSAQRKKTMI